MLLEATPKESACCCWLIARVRVARPRWHIAAAVLLLTAISGGLDQAAAAGAPSGLQLLAGVAAWDAIKLGTLSLHTAAVLAQMPARNPAPLTTDDLVSLLRAAWEGALP